MSGLQDVPNRLMAGFRRAFGEFLALPLLVVIGFIAMTALVFWADDAWSKGQVPSGFSWLGDLLGDSNSLATLLATIASSIMTVTSVTFSLLMIALQQGSSALTAQVTDQFLMRQSNQLYLGYFVGLSVFTLLSLVTASSIHRPVFGASLVVILTIVALCMIVVLIYNTIDQMRPPQIVRTIHQYILKARGREEALLAETRRTPRQSWPVLDRLRSVESGHLTRIDVARLTKALNGVGCGPVEVEFNVGIGQYLAYGDPLATIRAPVADAVTQNALGLVRDAVQGAIVFDDARDLRRDSSYGIRQLGIIAWTSISTAKSNPAPGHAVIESLRDILARWFDGDSERRWDDDALLVIPDNAPEGAIAVLEEIISAASESMQAQTLAHGLRTVAILLDTAPPYWSGVLVDVVHRGLASLGEHVLTRELEAALLQIAAALQAHGFGKVSHEVGTATAKLRLSLGELNSRSTRVPNAA